MLVQFEAVSDIIGNSRQLGDCRVFTADSKLGVWNQLVLVKEGGETGCYYMFE